MGKQHDQYCPLARALDIAGDRWTLLIVRELVPGPRRFTDLVGNLPGISRNLLTERLRDLERDGLVARTDPPPPAARQIYELTRDGRSLARAMRPLIGWGLRRLGERRPEQLLRPWWPALAMVSVADRDAASGVDETYQYVVGNDAFHFSVADGAIELHDGWADGPAVTVTTDEDTWTDIVTGKLSTSEAAAQGAVKVTGDRRSRQRLAAIFARTHVLAPG